MLQVESSAPGRRYCQPGAVQPTDQAGSGKLIVHQSAISPDWSERATLWEVTGGPAYRNAMRSPAPPVHARSKYRSPPAENPHWARPRAMTACAAVRHRPPTPLSGLRCNCDAPFYSTESHSSEGLALIHELVQGEVHTPDSRLLVITQRQTLAAGLEAAGLEIEIARILVVYRRQPA